VIISLMKVDDGEVKWWGVLDFYYAEAPMLMDYKDSSDQGYYSLATKGYYGGFTIARLKIDNQDSNL
jgi:hypothetical protein